MRVTPYLNPDLATRMASGPAVRRPNTAPALDVINALRGTRQSTALGTNCLVPGTDFGATKGARMTFSALDDYRQAKTTEGYPNQLQYSAADGDIPIHQAA
jgi:hypothetical protein